MRWGTPCARIAGSDGSSPARFERRDLVERARLRHSLEARVDARVKRLALGREEKGRAFRRLQNRRAARTLKGNERLACRLQDFQSPQQPLRIGLAQHGGRCGVARGEFGMKLLRGLVLRPGAHRFAHVAGHGGNVRKSVKRRLEIHSRAADENRRQFARIEIA